MPEQGFGIGAAFSSISNRLFDLEEARQQQYQQNMDYQLAQLRYTELMGRLKLLNLDLAAAAVYSPAEEAALKREADRLSNQAAEAENEIKQLERQLQEIRLDIADQTKGAEITKTFNEARRSETEAQKSKQELAQAILNTQQDQIDAIMPDKDVMEEISSMSPRLASSINSLAAIGRSQLYAGTDPRTGMSREVEFQRLLQNLNDLLYLDIGNDLREAFDLPPGEKIDIVSLAQMRMGRQADATTATQLVNSIYDLQRQEMGAGILDDNGQQGKGKPPSQFLQIVESFGGPEVVGQLHAQVVGDYIGAFVTKETNQLINVAGREAAARAAEQEALNRVEGVESPLWDGLKEQAAKIWEDTGDLYLQDIPALLFGDDQDKLEIFEGQDRRDTLDRIQESAMEIPGLRYNANPTSWIGKGLSGKFTLEGFTGDTGITQLYDPTQDAVVDVDKGYGYQLDDSLRMKLEYMLEPEQWEAIQALPPDRRRAVEAHLAVSLPGSPNLTGFVQATMTPGGYAMHDLGIGASPWKRGIYRENADDASVRNLLLGAGIGRAVGPTAKVLGMVGGKVASKVASPVVGGLRRLFGKGGAEAVKQTMDDAARMVEPPPLPGEIGPHSPANFWQAMSEGAVGRNAQGALDNPALGSIVSRRAASGGWGPRYAPAAPAPPPPLPTSAPVQIGDPAANYWKAFGSGLVPPKPLGQAPAAPSGFIGPQVAPLHPGLGDMSQLPSMGIQGLSAPFRPPTIKGNPLAPFYKESGPLLGDFSQPPLVNYTGPIGRSNLAGRTEGAQNLLSRLSQVLDDAEKAKPKIKAKGKATGKKSAKISTGKKTRDVEWVGGEGGPLKRYFNPATGEFLELPEGAAKLYKDELIDLSKLPKDLPGLKNFKGE